MNLFSNRRIRRALRGRRPQYFCPSANLLVPERAFDRVAALGEDAFDPFVEEQARAVDELVQHARGQVLGQIDSSGQPGPRGPGRRKHERGGRGLGLGAHVMTPRHGRRR